MSRNIKIEKAIIEVSGLIFYEDHCSVKSNFDGWNKKWYFIVQGSDTFGYVYIYVISLWELYEGKVISHVTPA